MLDFPMFFSSPFQAGGQAVVRPGLGDVFAGQETEAAHISEAVLVFIGGQSRAANSNASRGQQRERAPPTQGHRGKHGMAHSPLRGQQLELSSTRTYRGYPNSS